MPRDRLPLPTNPVESAHVAGLKYVRSGGPGIVRRRAGRGFVFTGVDGRPVRRQDVLQRIRALVIPPAWTDVWICLIADGHLQAVGRDAKRRWQYRYHSLYRQVRDNTKFYRMLEFGAALPALRKQVRADVRLPGLPKRKVVATVVRLMERTLIRVGNAEYAKTNHSHGLTTLQDRHVRVQGEHIRFFFRGKSGVRHEIEVDAPRLARIVKQCRDIPGQELFQYLASDGQPVPVDSGDVNEYVKEVTGQDFSAKDFRTWHGTVLATGCLLGAGPCQSQTQGKKNCVEVVKEVAGRLGNRAATCRKYYIHPAVNEAYMDGTLFEIAGQVRVPNPLPKHALNREERIVMEVLRRSAAKSTRQIVQKRKAA